MNRYRIITYLFWLLNAACCVAQDSIPPKKLYMNFCGHYGFIIAHHKNMENLIKAHIPAGEINLLMQTKGEKHWEQVYHNPEKGLGIYYADFGNPEQLGQGIAIFPFINFPLNPGRKVKLYVRSSDGIGIVTKYFNRVENHKNIVIGSYVNAFINLRLNSVFYPAKKIRMETGIGLTHFSNGAFAKPNLGINLATVHLGISFQSAEIRSSAAAAPTQGASYKKYCTVLTCGAGINENTPPNGKKYMSYMLSLSRWKQVSEKSKFGAGAEAFYEFANIENAIRDSSFDTSKPLNNLQSGIKLGYELVIGKITLPLEMGVYTFTKTTANGPLYHRIGVRYFANKHLIINYTLKTHWATAENFELGLGYRF